MSYQLNPLFEQHDLFENFRVQRTLANLGTVRKQCLFKKNYKHSPGYLVKLYKIFVKDTTDGRLKSKYFVTCYGGTNAKLFDNKEESVSFVKSILARSKPVESISSSIGRDVQGHGYGEYVNGGLMRNSLRYL